MCPGGGPSPRRKVSSPLRECQKLEDDRNSWAGGPALGGFWRRTPHTMNKKKLRRRLKHLQRYRCHGTILLAHTHHFRVVVRQLIAQTKRSQRQHNSYHCHHLCNKCLRFHSAVTRAAASNFNPGHGKWALVRAHPCLCGGCAVQVACDQCTILKWTQSCVHGLMIPLSALVRD